MAGVTSPLRLVVAGADRRQAPFLGQGAVWSSQPIVVLASSLYESIVEVGGVFSKG